MISLAKKDLLVWDSLFVLGLMMLLFATDYFAKANISIVFLLGFSFLACVKRHIKYNRQHIN